MPRVLTDSRPCVHASAAGADLEEVARAFGHDLREQLGLLSVYNDLMRHRAGVALGPEGERLLARSAVAVARSRELVADLTTFLRLVPAPPPLVPTSSDSALDGALRSLEPSIEARHARVVREPLPPVNVVVDHVQQIFERLIDNAIKFSGQEPPAIRISCRRRDGLAEFQVSDNGLGVDPRYAENAFRPLARLHGHTYPGTGMGLTFCRRITGFYGGSIWLESSAGAGARVHFSLPLPGSEGA
jgi:light-regulated signal transduction histidine kinase (bacteriophytochrome)